MLTTCTDHVLGHDLLSLSTQFLTQDETDHVSSADVHCDEETKRNVKVIILDEPAAGGEDHLKCSSWNQHLPAAVPSMFLLRAENNLTQFNL